MMESDRETCAHGLLRRVQRLLASFRGKDRSELPAFAGTYFYSALCVFDLKTARSIAMAFNSDRHMVDTLANIEANIADSEDLAYFVTCAAHAFGDAGAAVRLSRDCDLTISVAPALLPAFTTDQTASVVKAVEMTRGRQALARVLSLAQERGLQVNLAVAPGRAVPAKIVQSAKPFVSYHTFGSHASGWHVKAGPLPDTLLIDASGYAGWASTSRAPLAAFPLAKIEAAFARSWRVAEMSRLSKVNQTKYAQKARGSVALEQTASVLVALQVPSDTVMRHAWLDMFELTRAVVRRYCSSDVAVLIKRHPRCVDPRTDVLLRDVASEPHVTITDASIHDLFAVVKAVYCVNSGVGAEALLYGLPVHISGLTDYRHVCHEIHRVEDIRADDSAFRLPVDEATFDRYVYWYRNIHHVPLDQPGALDAAIEERILRPALARRDGKRR
jgi:hypothetical protein